MAGFDGSDSFESSNGKGFDVNDFSEDIDELIDLAQKVSKDIVEFLGLVEQHIEQKMNARETTLEGFTDDKAKGEATDDDVSYLGDLIDELGSELSLGIQEYIVKKYQNGETKYGDLVDLLKRRVWVGGTLHPSIKKLINTDDSEK